MIQTSEHELIDRAVSGDKKALETLITSVQDLVSNLSLRMLGSIIDAEDASQEIIVKIITHLSSFRKESAFSTWAYRIATNYLINYKKTMFAQHPLSFDFYGDDIDKGFIENTPELLHSIDENILADELKMSCSNVMLQCFDAESRCIYILGIMFRLDSKIAGDILGINPDTYRQKLSRIRKKMTDFLKKYCGLADGMCNCKKRVGYAINNHRLNPSVLEYSELQTLNETTLANFTEAMENLDSLSLIFADMPKYQAPQKVKNFILHIIQSNDMQTVCTC